MVIRGLARVREVATRFLTETCVIEEEVVSTDQYGAAAHTWRVRASGVACRVITESRMSGSDTTEVGSQKALVEHLRLVVPEGTALDVNQRVTVGGDVYQIVAVLVGHTDAVFASAVIARVHG
jgi:hypothetical protein